MNLLFRGGAWLLILIALAITAAIYWSGLHGGFIYDDFSFVVGNEAIKVTDLRFGNWIAAAISFPAGSHAGRWLTMLSFAANHYFTGMDPFGFKATNLVIHLVNGVLLFLLLRKLFALSKIMAPAAAPRGASFDINLAAAVLASLWLVLPINLTGVLYVSQRLESMSTTLVFAGLWWYLGARVATLESGKHGIQLWVSLIVCTGVGVAIKESAVLLPLYAACVEFVVTRGRQRDGRISKSVLALYGVLLVVPLVVGLVWLSSWVDGTRTYGRAFDIPSRLLTEARVLVDYMAWTLAPSLDVLTLYHDDIEISRGVVDPPSTLASLLLIGALLAAAFWQRTQRPLFALGIFWFFAGHALTATVIPLILAFEHRNYFPSVGLLLAVASLFAIETHLMRRRVLAFAAVCLFAFYASTTALRAQEWADPTRLALSEASKRPQSPNAQFARGWAMVSGMRRMDGTPMVEDGYMVLEDSMHLPGASTSFEQSLITLHAEHHEPINPAWWDSLIEKLKAKPPSVSDARVLTNLNHCYMDGFCGTDLGPLQAAYAAALSHGEPPPTMLSVHAEFAWHILQDHDLAERDMRAATRLVPLDINARRNLAVLLISTGKLGDARNEIMALRRLNHFGMFDTLIDPVDEVLRKKEAESGMTRS